MVIKFNVFGKHMSVLRCGQEWQLYHESDTSLRVRVYDVVLPPELQQTELSSYLDDIYHEYASEKHPAVIKMN
ncbi:hypothetical protein J8L98_15330 [Pseudoalteromonas sp. MMG013]|uniref:DUF7661 family protein n=1 Tax=Pseudoalteromonas sp. MMG013 TaxID=2822687 RepID=UPI001B394E62|nr:hypothetical protein [Pseudoalteromonas sp. MMG013]MBQ4863057.1 hypothetical protein [Pseudoalteromonas sp. MMG013]